MYPQFPSVVDSTMTVAFRACRRKFEYEHIHKLAPTFQSVDLHFGGAVARGLEVARKAHYILGRPADEAQADGINAAWEFYGKFDTTRTEYSLAKKPKNESTLLLAMEGYFREWPLGKCGLTPYASNQGIEFTFAIPLPGTANPTTGDPVIYGGRFDLLGDWQGIPVVEDEKTASSFEEKWAEKWALRNQFLGYVWAARQFGIPVDHVLIRGIAIQRTDIKFLQALSTFPSYMLDRWYEEIVATVNEMTAAYTAGRFAYNLGDSCNSYGGCTFMEICKSKTPEDWFSNFARRDWSPLRQNPEVEKEAA